MTSPQATRCLVQTAVDSSGRQEVTLGRQANEWFPLCVPRHHPPTHLCRTVLGDVRSPLRLLSAGQLQCSREAGPAQDTRPWGRSSAPVSFQPLCPPSARHRVLQNASVATCSVPVAPACPTELAAQEHLWSSSPAGVHPLQGPQGAAGLCPLSLMVMLGFPVARVPCLRSLRPFLLLPPRALFCPTLRCHHHPPRSLCGGWSPALFRGSDQKGGLGGDHAVTVPNGTRFSEGKLSSPHPFSSFVPCCCYCP